MIRKAMSFAQDGALFVIAAHPNLALPAWLMRVVLRSSKTIVMTHGVEVWTRLPFLRWKALSNADLILAPSTDTVRKLIDMQGLASSKIRKLAWPLNPDFLAMADSPQRFQVPRDFPEGRVVLTVGRWASAERYKGIDELIHATALIRSKVDNLHLVVVGQGDDLPRLRKLAIEVGGAKSVHFLGHVSREELAACYAGADVFAMPSSGEGFGLVFLEAMAFAKPIVAISRGGTTDLVEHEVNGLLVPSGDVQGLANALESLLMNDLFRTAMGQRGAKLVRDKYGFGNFKIELEQILGGPPIAPMVSWNHP
jgi:glycosyltransferase involved in cell wall biosynthesis